MLNVLPTEVTLIVLSHLPIPSLLSLAILSRQWLHFFATHQSEIFHRAALYHEYIPPGTLLLEDALSMNTGKPWAGSTSWKDFCKWVPSQLISNLQKLGRKRACCCAHVIASRLQPLLHQGRRKSRDMYYDSHWGGITVTHLLTGTVLWCLPTSIVPSRSPCGYENGFLVFGNNGGATEVWRLASDFTAADEFAADAPPDDKQIAVSRRAAAVFHHYAPRGQFRAWALLRPPDSVPKYTYRLRYPTLIYASYEHAFLYDVRTGTLVQTINIHLRTLYSVDVNERHAFVCEVDVVHVYLLESGVEVLRIPADENIFRSHQFVKGPSLVPGDWFISPVSFFPRGDVMRRSKFIDAHVSRDGRNLVVLSKKHHVLFVRDFERICCGEATFEQASFVLGIHPDARCYSLSFEHGRVCVATTKGLYIFTFGPANDLFWKAVLVRPSEESVGYLERSCPINCIQLTDRRIYFTWGDSMRRQDIPLFEDAENVQAAPPPATPILDLDFEVPPIFMGRWRHDPFESSSLGCIDFSLMPEGYAGET
ncbi:hypothetical protein EI94DRAFT_1225204 [Lactarius quietus]|nr:hypothetical protein EI94DRAFT_1225204 [Lactarius quietus]